VPHCEMQRHAVWVPPNRTGTGLITQHSAILPLDCPLHVTV
jgi:hypothetical protein